jgi:hypothetical protein
LSGSAAAGDQSHRGDDENGNGCSYEYQNPEVHRTIPLPLFKHLMRDAWRMMSGREE